MSVTEQLKALNRVADAWRRITDSARSNASGEPLASVTDAQTPPEKPAEQQIAAPPR